MTCIDSECCNVECGVCGECTPTAAPDDMVIDALENETQRIVLGVDSGAAVTCIKPDVASDYPLKKVVGRTLRGAGGGEITSYGDRHVGLMGSDSRTRILRCGVADVRKNLLAVSQLIDQDHEVVFSKKRCYIKHTPTGWTVEMTRRNGVFEIEMNLVPYFRGAPPAGRR